MKNKPTRVSIVILSKHIGGAERHVIDLANYLAAHGWAIQLVTRAMGWVDSTTVGTFNPSIRISRFLPILGHWGLRHVLAGFQPDIIHSHLGMGSRLVGRLNPTIPLVATIHGGYKHKNYHRHDALICVAPWQAQTISSDFHGSVQVIPNFIKDATRPHHSQKQIRHSLGIPEDAFIVGSVGRFSAEKGFDILIKAFHRAAIPNSRLVLVGDGPEKPTLLGQSRENVIFTGWIDNPIDHIAAMNLYVSSSHSESFGLAVLQAMQLGIPVLSTRTQGSHYLLADGTGSLVEIGDTSALADQIVAFYQSPDFCKEMGYRGIEKSHSFKSEEVIPKIISLYLKLIKQGSHRTHHK